MGFTHPTSMSHKWRVKPPGKGHSQKNSPPRAKGPRAGYFGNAPLPLPEGFTWCKNCGNNFVLKYFYFDTHWVPQ